MLNLSLFLYREQQGQFELHLSEFSTLDGLKAIDEDLNVKLIGVGASGYKNYGWATEKEFPNWNTVKEIKSFFELDEEIGLIDFEVEFLGYGRLSTHDDGECNFRFRNKGDLINVLKKVVPPAKQDVVISALLNNPDKYIKLDKSGNLNKYHTFDQYVKESKST